MGKSKLRKNRKTGPHKTLAQLASKRAGANFVKLITQEVEEGTNHVLTLETDAELITVILRPATDGVIREDPRVSNFIMTAVTKGVDAGILLETYTPSAKYVRVWLVQAGVLHRGFAADAQAVFEAGEDFDGVSLPTFFKDAHKLNT